MAAGEEFGILPCGLGARDTLRTEMGYPLHGQDISLDITPVEARLSAGRSAGGRTTFWGTRRAAQGEGGRAASGACAASSPSAAASRGPAWA